MSASAFFPNLKILGMLGRPSRRPPKEDIDKALAQHMQIPPKKAGSDHIPVISDASFNSIANYLGLSPDPHIAQHGKNRPRIYTILSHINRTDVFAEFVKSGFTDLMLPIPTEELPVALGRDKSKFHEIQRCCLTDAADLEKGEEGRHLVLDSGPTHLVRLEDLGAGGFG